MIIKKYIVYFILVFAGFFSASSNIVVNSPVKITAVQQPQLYKDFGVFEFPNVSLPYTVTSYRLYMTREVVNKYQKSNMLYPYNYIYKIWGVSLSKYYGHPRNTFIIDFDIYWNHGYQTLNSYPLALYVEKNPTLLYIIKSNDINPHIFIRWTRSFYDASR